MTRLLSLLFGARPPRCERDEAVASMQLYSTRREVLALPIKEAPAPLDTARGVTHREASL